MELTIIITTYKRLKILEKCIKSIRKYEPDCKILLVIDGNDWEAYYYACCQKLPFIFSSEKREHVAQMNLGIYLCNTEYFIYLSDDMMFTQEKQISKALDTFKEKFPDGNGLITFNDGIVNGTIATHGLTSKTYVKTIGGYLMNPIYTHYCGDTELTLVSMPNRFLYLPDIKVSHEHFSVTGNTDDVYKKSEDLYWKRDYAEFVKRWGDTCIEELKQGTWKGLLKSE